VLHHVGEQQLQRGGPHLVGVELGLRAVLQEDGTVGLGGADQAHGPGAIETLVDFLVRQDGRFSVSRVEQDAVVERVDDAVVAFQALQEDAVAQDQRTRHAQRAVVALRAAHDVLHLHGRQHAGAAAGVDQADQHGHSGAGGRAS
jgi:hypothetical protein